MERKQKLLAKKATAPVEPMEVKDFTTADGLTIQMEGVRVFVAPNRESAARVVKSMRVSKATFYPTERQKVGGLSVGEEQMLDDASKSLDATHTNLNSANECIEAFLQQGR